MSGPEVLLVADDYGLSPAVSAGIRRLIAAKAISGTGCMTLFPEWPEEAARLSAMQEAAESHIGLHLTLTDFVPLTGESELAPDGKLPDLMSLMAPSGFAAPMMRSAVQAELDAQFDRFVAAMGRLPDYLDGHQHIHFLKVVRPWFRQLARRLKNEGKPLPWVRGAPALSLAPGLSLKAKTAFVWTKAFGFEFDMWELGYPVKGPLAGFYDWKRPQDFAGAMRRLATALADKPRKDVVVMCHPGDIDDVLKSRDRLIEARAVEKQVLLAGCGLTPLRKAERGA